MRWKILRAREEALVLGFFWTVWICWCFEVTLTCRKGLFFLGVCAQLNHPIVTELGTSTAEHTSVAIQEWSRLPFRWVQCCVPTGLRKMAWISGGASWGLLGPQPHHTACQAAGRSLLPLETSVLCALRQGNPVLGTAFHIWLFHAQSSLEKCIVNNNDSDNNNNKE